MAGAQTRRAARPAPRADAARGRRAIGERGFSETRIADVARRAGASPALVIYYFSTKDELLTEALRFSERSFYADVAGQLERAARPPASGSRCWSARPASRRARARSPASWGLWFDLWAQAFRHPEVTKDRIELDQRWRGHDRAGRPGRAGRRRDRPVRRRRRVRHHVLRAARRPVDPGRAGGPGRRRRPGLRDRDGLRCQGPRRRLAAAPDDRVRPGARSLTPAGRAEPRWRRRPRRPHR